MSGSRLGRFLAVLFVAFALAGCTKDRTDETAIGDAATIVAPSTTGPAATVAPSSTRGATSNAAPSSTAPSSTTATATVGGAGGALCAPEPVKEGLAAAGLQFTEPIRFSCVGSWAYAETRPAGESGAPAQVAVLQANGPRWSVIDTATACAGATIDPMIRQQACPH